MAMDALFPPLCLNCRRNVREKFGLCSQCLAQVEFTGLRGCIRCGRICGGRTCAPLDHRYSRVLSLAHYLGPWRKVVQAAKFARDRRVTMELARELARLAGEAGFPKPQAVTPAPAAGKLWRYVDAVGLTARELARNVGAPLVRALAGGRAAAPGISERAPAPSGSEDYIHARRQDLTEISAGGRCLYHRRYRRRLRRRPHQSRGQEGVGADPGGLMEMGRASAAGRVS